MNSSFILTPEVRATIIESVLAILDDNYVFPDKATAMRQHVQARVAGGVYDTITDPELLHTTLTADLRHAHHDWHLRVVYHATPQPPRTNAYADPTWLAAYWQAAALDNYGVHKVERLAGNVGYLKLNSIDEAEETAPVLAAAMALVANTSALLIDLRHNHGGAPSGVAFFCSYFFGAEPIHLNDFYVRPTNTTQQFWTSAFVPGSRYLNKPVYVMVSHETFSGGEEIAYDLQVLQRATIVGETTRGGANPVDVLQVHPHFDVRVPTGRAINPITGTNWEGVGVIPDVKSSESETMGVAYRLALQQIIETHADTAIVAYQDLVTEARNALAELV